MTDNNSLLIYTEHFFAASDVTLANESTAIKIIDIALFQTISVSFDTHAIEAYQQLGSLCNVYWLYSASARYAEREPSGSMSGNCRSSSEDCWPWQCLLDSEYMEGYSMCWLYCFVKVRLTACHITFGNTQCPNVEFHLVYGKIQIKINTNEKIQMLLTNEIYYLNLCNLLLHVRIYTCK